VRLERGKEVERKKRSKKFKKAKLFLFLQSALLRNLSRTTILLLPPPAALDGDELDAPVGPAPLLSVREGRRRSQSRGRRKREHQGRQLAAVDAPGVDPRGPRLQLHPASRVVTEDDVPALSPE